MIAPASAPASGRANSRARGDLRPTRSSSRGGGAASRVSLIKFPPNSGLGAAGQRRRPAARGAYRVPRAAYGAIVAMLLESMNARAGQHRLPAAEHVGVGLAQPQRVDGQVALQVRLLVHGPLHLPRLDLGDLRGVGVEGVELGAAVRLLDRVDRDQRDRRAQRDDRVDALVLGQLGVHGGLHRGVVGAVDVELGHRALGAEPLLHARAPGLELDLALGLQHAEHVLGAGGGQPLAGRRPGHGLIRPEVLHPAALTASCRCRR